MYRFAAKYARYRMVVEPARQVYANDGSGRVVQSDLGKDVQFEGHEFLTEDEGLANWIRAQRGFGTDVMEIAVEDVIPSALKPEVVGSVTTATQVKEKGIRCPECGKLLVNKSQFKMHYKTHLKEGAAEDEPTPEAPHAPAPPVPVS